MHKRPDAHAVHVTEHAQDVQHGMTLKHILLGGAPLSRVADSRLSLHAIMVCSAVLIAVFAADVVSETIVSC